MDAVIPLAGQLVQVLTPFLPYLVTAGEGLTTRAAQQIEDSGWDLANKVWGRLGSKLQARPAAREAAADVAAQPADEDAQAALRVQLRKLLADEPDLQRELAGLLKETGGSATTTTTTVTVSGNRGVGIGRDVGGSTIITGDQNRP